jgi:hypothetical protein
MNDMCTSSTNQAEVAMLQVKERKQVTKLVHILSGKLQGQRIAHMEFGRMCRVCCSGQGSPRF